MGRHGRDRKGSWIYKYLRNQRRSPLKLWVQILNLCTLVFLIQVKLNGNCITCILSTLNCKQHTLLQNSWQYSLRYMKSVNVNIYFLNWQEMYVLHKPFYLFLSIRNTPYTILSIFKHRKSPINHFIYFHA